MSTVPITIRVDAEAAKAFAAASPEERKKIELLLSIHLKDITLRTPRTLREVMDEMGAKAARNGLTPEILESILRDEEE